MRRRTAAAVGIVSGLTLAAVTSFAQGDPAPPPGDAEPSSREAVLAAFEQTLARHDSATEALAEWCRARGLTPEANGAPVIRAERLHDRVPHVMDDMRRVMDVGAHEPLGYRHVRLRCGPHVLSDARNLYVPARLTADMNHTLGTTDRPFGAVIAPLAFRRERWASRRGADSGCPAETVLNQQALIRMADGTPLAFVVECYQPAVLGVTRR